MISYVRGALYVLRFAIDLIILSPQWSTKIMNAMLL